MFEPKARNICREHSSVLAPAVGGAHHKDECDMARSNRPLALAGLALSMIAAAWSPPAIANGFPVVSLAPTLLGRSGITVYSTVATPVTTARVMGYGPSPDFAPIYDTSALQGVTTRPISNVRINGENVDIEYDDEAAARASHATPDFSGRHNPALSNFERLPPSLR